MHTFTPPVGTVYGIKRNGSLTVIQSDAPSQADVAVYKAVQSAPDAEKYPHAARWYKHIASHESEFANLPGDASQSYTTYGPDASEVTVNPAANPEAEEDVDLFGSDDEEEDEEAARIREERLAEYKKKKEAKPKTTAKSIVTMDVKPWGKWFPRMTTLRLSAYGGLPSKVA